MRLVRSMHTTAARRVARHPLRWSGAALAVAGLALAGCGSSASSSPSAAASSTAKPGGTFTILANSCFGVADPAQNYTLQEWQLLIDTHDGLTAFAKEGGIAGTKIVPDLATSIPLPTNGGKTYVFHIRRGIKFSNGQTLTPSAFVTTFERQFTVPGPTTFYTDIVGASACSTKGCSLSKGVIANDSAYTLTINLTGPDPELMDQLALPFAFAVPPDTSLKLTGNNVPPGTGPYMWKSYNPNTEAVLVRNPYFKVWSKVAQPHGYPNEIIEKYGLQVSDEVTEVKNGEANEVFDGDQIPSDQLTQLNSAKYASQVHVNTLTADWYMALNTRTPPFNNVKARQAINYAANRTAYVKIAGGPSLAVRPARSCRRTSPRTWPTARTPRGRRPSWSGPNLAKAKQLVQQSGTAGMKVVVDGTNDQVGKALVEQMVSDLDSIGYKATPQLLTAGRPVPVRAELDELRQVERRLVGLVPGLPGAVRLPERAARLQHHPPEQRRQPQHRRVLRPVHPGADQPGRVGGGDRPVRRRPSCGRRSTTRTPTRRPGSTCTTPSRSTSCPSNVHGYMWNPQWYILIDQLWLS